MITIKKYQQRIKKYKTVLKKEQRSMKYEVVLPGAAETGGAKEMANWSSGQNTQPYTPTTVYSKEYQRVETLLTNNVGPTCETTLGNPKLG